MVPLNLLAGLRLHNAALCMAAGAAALLGGGIQLCRRSDVERLYAGREYLLET